jgi:hypothetical protein
MLDQLYAQSVLDCLVESAVAISTDYYTRPNQYGRVSDAVAGVLQNLKSKTGSDPEFPNYAQRQAMYGALIGGPDDTTSSFATAAAEVRAAASDYAQAAILHGQVAKTPVTSPGEPALRRAFLDALSTFQGVLSIVDQTAALKSTTNQTQKMFQASAGVFADGAVAAAFGVQPAPGSNWPITNQQDGKGALLIQEVSQRLAGGSLRAVRMRQFLLLQRAAVAGAKTVHFALGADKVAADDKLTAEAIEAAYSWATALNELNRARQA